MGTGIYQEFRDVLPGFLTCFKSALRKRGLVASLAPFARNVPVPSAVLQCGSSYRAYDNRRYARSL